MANDSNAQSGTAAPTTPQGQQPTPSTPPAGASPAGTNAPQASANSTSTEIQNPEAHRYAQEAAELRKLVKQHEAELKKRDEASMTAEQKREREFSELQTKALDYELRLQRQELRLAGYDLAPSLGIGDIRAALALVQDEHAGEIKFTDGKPENLGDLLKAVLQEHPALAANAAGQQRPPVGSGGATNPGASARPGTFTREQISKMSTREYEQNRAAIMESLKQGAIRP